MRPPRLPSKNWVPYMYCRDFDKICPFWVMGADRVQTWPDDMTAQLHPDIKQGPWTCFHGEKFKVARTVNPESPNLCRFFLRCHQEESRKFFQWLDSEWSNRIIQHRLGKAKRRGYPNEVEQFNKFKRGQQRIKNELERMEKEMETNVIPPVPPIPDDRLKKELEKFYRRQRFFDHTKRMKELDKREEQWCRQLEQTRPITPGLLRACFVDLLV